MTVKWKCTQTWNVSLPTCKKTTLQTCHRFISKILHSCDTQRMKVHSVGGVHDKLGHQGV